MSKIIRHSYGIKDVRDEAELRRAMWQDAKYKQTEQAVTESNQRIAAIDARTKDEEFIRRRAEIDSVKRAVPSKLNSVYEQGKVLLFKEILIESYLDALVMDDDFVQENRTRFEQLISDYVDRNGGYSMLEEAVKTNPIPFLRAVKETCDTVARQASLRIAREARKEPTLANLQVFELDAEEKSLFEEKKSELSLDQVSKLVKNKVLTVVKDERDRQSKERELMEDLKARAQETGEEAEKPETPLGTATLKESTLFNSIMHNAYSSYLETVQERGGTAGTTSRFVDAVENDDDDEIEGDFDHNATASKLNNEAPSTMDYTSPVNDDVNLDLIMCEALTYYTLMELTNTVCLETFSAKEIMNMSHKFLNKRK